jgi:hypothetical protein
MKKRLIVVIVVALLLLSGLGYYRLVVLRHREPARGDTALKDDDRSESPSATREGTTITLTPSQLTFRIPKEWVGWYREFGNNFHLTRDELDKVENADSEWDTEYARVCNAVLPFSRCAAHIGEEGWGRESHSFGDLQVRVFDLTEPLEDVERRVDAEGVNEVERITGKRPAPEHESKGEWKAAKLSYFRFYIDYGATAHVDFRLRRFGERTIVFVFRGVVAASGNSVRHAAWRK